MLLPGVLADLAGGEKHVHVEPAGDTLADLLDALAAEHPMLARRIRDETGQVRRFVNVYVDGDDVRFDGRPGDDGARRRGGAGAAVGRRRLTGPVGPSEGGEGRRSSSQSCWSS